MRLFVGVPLEGEARDEVLRVREKLIVPLTRQGVRFVRPEKLHLTLAFLGNVDAESVSDLGAVLAEVHPAPMAFQLAGLGCFPHCHRPKVIWIGLRGDTVGLTEVSRQVAEAARPLAPDLDDKPFSPHITLARISPGSKEVGRLLEQSRIEIDPAPVRVDSFSLYHSVPDGSYEILRHFPFAPDF